MKKIVITIIAFMLIALFTTNSFAASLLSENERAIIDKLKSISSIPAEYINQAENFFLRDEVDIDNADALDAIANIENAEKIVVENGINSFADLKNLSTTSQQNIIDIIKKTADIFGAEAAIDVNKKVAVVTYKGATVFESRGVIQKTGFDASPILLGIIATIVIAFISLLFLFSIQKKRKLMDKLKS